VIEGIRTPDLLSHRAKPENGNELSDPLNSCQCNTIDSTIEHQRTSGNISNYQVSGLHRGLQSATSSEAEKTLDCDAELLRIVEAWQTLPTHIKAAMIALLQSCCDH